MLLARLVGPILIVDWISKSGTRRQGGALKVGLTSRTDVVAMGSMKTKWFVFAASLAAVLISGCVNTVDGHRQAGVPFVADKIESRFERTPQEITTAAKDVLIYNGKLTSEDVLKGTLEAAVDTRTVWVKIEPVDEKVTRVLVQTRTKGGGADRALASEINTQIAVRLASGNLTPAASAPRSP